MNIYQRLMNSTVWSPADAGTGTSGDQGKPPAGGSGDGQGTKLSADGSAGAGANGQGFTLEGLVKDPDNLEYAKTKNWESGDALLKSYRDLEAEHSKAKGLKLPTKESKPEEVDAFYEQLGMPKEAKGYEFKLPDNVPKEFPYEEDSANQFRDVARKARLTTEQASLLHDWYVNTRVEGWNGSLQQAKTQIEGAHKEITDSWGNPEGTEYKRNIEMAERSLRELSDPKDRGALRKELVEMGALTPDGMVRAPKLVKALAKIGEALFSEDKVYGGEASQHNPFKDESENLTAQGKIIQEDPERARQLILAANKDPASYGLKAPT